MAYLSVLVWSFIPIAFVGIAFGVLRGAGDTRTPMAVSILMNVFNIIFSYSLIYGLRLPLFTIPGLGVRGAALGLTLARACGALLVLLPLLRGSRQIRLADLRLFRWEGSLLRRIFRLGLPASAESLMFNGGRLIVQTFLVSLGTVMMAANTIATSLVNLMLIPGLALEIATMTVVGQQIGRGQPREAKKQIKILVLATMAGMALISLLIVPLREPLVRLYTQDLPTIRQTLVILISALIAYPCFWAFSFIMPAGLRGAGDVRYTMTVSGISMWLLRILLGYIFAVLLHWGALGVWLAMYVDWLGRGALFFRRLSGSRWHQKSMFPPDARSGYTDGQKPRGFAAPRKESP